MGSSDQDHYQPLSASISGSNEGPRQLAFKLGLKVVVRIQNASDRVYSCVYVYMYTSYLCIDDMYQYICRFMCVCM